MFFLTTCKIRHNLSPISKRLYKCCFSHGPELEYCVNLVKQHDLEHYLAGLFLPLKYRVPFFAIRAFNAEIAIIRQQIPRNTRHAGRIRFQYWRDVLNEIYSGNRISHQSPVGSILRAVVAEHNLSARWFERSLEARYFFISILLSECALLLMRDI